MRAQQIARGVVLYEKERADLEREAAVALARRQAAVLPDGEAAEVGALFPQWGPGTAYRPGERVSDEAGHLYRVEQAHVSQADWPLETTPALYTRLGVDGSDPEAVPEWRQPTGAQDAYRKGDRVRYGGKVWESAVDGNVWAPDVEGWTEVAV